ncbi:uncharacterized protein si:ch211-80h18.1 [Hypomesus transpacificus]|uniref:uncharacterized protein si:ch211-80h18.1 n=1 Tax=Hypomesus transpacificus TaxID=137520 RepID=UPI001F078E55|nr:uncharacterized protein si:ch211-80h18.1 [Hypomesus transpacificus]
MSVGAEGHGSSSSQLQAPGTEGGHADTTSHGSEAPEMEFNGNGHKLLNGALENGHSALGTDPFTDGTAHTDSTAGALEPLGTDSHLDYTGIIDESSHDFLIGLMGGVDPFGPDIHIEADLDLLSSSSPYPDAHPGSSPDHAVSGSDDPPAADTGMGDYAGHMDAPDAASVISLPDHLHIDYPDVSSTDSADSNGNGRQSLVIDTHGGDHHVDDHIHIMGTIAATVLVDGVDDVHAPTPAPVLADVHSSTASDAPGADDVTVTSGLLNFTESEFGLGHNVTGAGDFHIVVDHTESSVTGVPSNTFPQTDAVGTYTATDTATDMATGTATDTATDMATGTTTDTTTDMATDKGTADPQAARGSSQPAGTEQSQLAVPAAEQYNTSGQGPEGAEDVELEDTC